MAVDHFRTIMCCYEIANRITRASNRCLILLFIVRLLPHISCVYCRIFPAFIAAYFLRLLPHISCVYCRIFPAFIAAYFLPFILIPGHTEAVTGLAFDPTGNNLASCSADMSAKIWDLATYICIKTLKVWPNTFLLRSDASMKDSQ
jgi:WD40 repeat protein